MTAECKPISPATKPAAKSSHTGESVTRQTFDQVMVPNYAPAAFRSEERRVGKEC